MEDLQEKVYIYTLSDPRTQEVRYVGSTINLKKRLVVHLSNPLGRGMQEWIAELKDSWLTPLIQAIDTVGELERELVKWQWLQCYTDLGARLLNTRVKLVAPVHSLMDSPLRRRRLQMRLTQKALGQTIGVKRLTIARYEAGESFPDHENLTKLREITGLPTDAILYPAQFLANDPTFLVEFAKHEPRKGHPPQSS